MKVVAIIGGLGSQMIKYAMYVAIKNQTPDICLIDSTYYLQNHSWNGLEIKRIFGIDDKDMANILSSKELADIKNHQRNYVCVCLKHLLQTGNVEYYFLGKKISYTSKSYLASKVSDLGKLFTHKLLYGLYSLGIKYSLPQNFEDEKNVYIDEYKQTSDELFRDYKDEIRKAFVFPELDCAHDELNYKTAKEMEGCSSVALHVRRTDSMSYNGNLIENGYYKSAVSYIKEHAPKPLKVYIFSDDIEWCKKNLNLIGLDKTDFIVFVDWNRGENSYKDMQLMTYCQHNVIPVSSFSWWGYYLSRRENKIVCAPKGIWFDVKFHF